MHRFQQQVGPGCLGARPSSGMKSPGNKRHCTLLGQHRHRVKPVSDRKVENWPSQVLAQTPRLPPELKGSGQQTSKRGLAKICERKVDGEGGQIKVRDFLVWCATLMPHCGLLARLLVSVENGRPSFGSNPEIAPRAERFRIANSMQHCG